MGRRLPAFTLSHLSSGRSAERQTFLDTGATVSTAALHRNTRLAARALPLDKYCQAQYGNMSHTAHVGWRIRGKKKTQDKVESGKGKQVQVLFGIHHSPKLGNQILEVH
jgi:hypothetical protein